MHSVLGVPKPYSHYLYRQKTTAQIQIGLRGFAFLYCCVIQQKVRQPDIQYTVVVIPALADIFADNDLRERIIRERERF